MILLRKIGHRPRLVYGLIYQGDLQVRNGTVLEGVRLLAAAEVAGLKWQHFFYPLVGSQIAKAVELARTQLGPDRFAAAWAEGQAMTIDQAVAYSLGEKGD
jgi:hypothetical protein